MSDIAISVKGLTKTFGDRKAVDDITFELHSGSFMTVFGPNGAGKTTLLRMIATLTRPTSGSNVISGFDVHEQPDNVREVIGLISHNTMLYGDLTAEENLVFYGSLYGVADPAKRAVELLEMVGLKHRRLDPVKTFSRGMVQRVAIARALMNDPSVLLLDEPYAGLDPHAVAIFDEIIESIRKGRTFIMVSHDLRKGFDMCTHALVMDKGHALQFAERDVLENNVDGFFDLYRATINSEVS